MKNTTHVLTATIPPSNRGPRGPRRRSPRSGSHLHGTSTARIRACAARRQPSRAPRSACRTAGRGTVRATVGLALALLLFALPVAAQEAEASKPAKQETAAKERVVNINTADASQLALLPRVGPALSQRILDFRQENGKFAAPEELILVRGIGEKTFELLEPYVVVEGKTTLTEKVRGVSGGSR